MNKFAKIALPFAFASAAAAAAVYMVKPAKATEEQKLPFVGRNIAHRGLFTEDQFTPENSLSAFDLAIQAGYGIELDVHITEDDRIVVFHDDTLERMCDAEGRVEDCFWAELKNLPLSGGDETMPLLSDVLNLVGGRCPIILELKPDRHRNELCERTLEFIRSYNGDICVESFDPRIVAWFRKNAPEILRGQLSQPAGDFGDAANKLQAFALGNLLTNFISRPHFVAYKIGKKPFLVRLCDRLGAIKVGWTAHDPSAEFDNDVVIFEHYRPSQRFR